MTKSDLVEQLSQMLKLPLGRSEALVNAIFDCLEEALCRGELIEIRGFGSFEIRHYRARQGRNPRTGASVQVKPKRLPYFKVGKELRARVAKGMCHTRELSPILDPESFKTTAVEIPAIKS